MKILIFLISSTIVYANTISFTLTNRIPTDLKLILAHIESSEFLSEYQIKTLKSDIDKINNYYSSLEDANALFTLKSTLYSSLLDYRNSDYQQVTVKTSDFKIIQNRLKSQISLHSKFTVWFIEQIEDDFKDFIKDEYLNKYETAPLTEVNNKRKKEITRLLKFYSPIIRIYKSYDASKLSEFNTKITLFCISQIAAKLPYFQHTNLRKNGNLQLITYKIESKPSKSVNPDSIMDAQSTKEKTIEALKTIEPKNKKEALDLLDETN